MTRSNRCTLALAFAPLALLLGCNTAQLNVAPQLDAGPPCSAYAPTVSCDAGGTIAPTSCAAEPTSSDPNVSRIPSGNYPPGCSVQFYFDDNGGGCAPAQNPCTCIAGDAGDSDAASVPGYWSNCADAGQSLIE